MFKPLPDLEARREIALHVEGREVIAREGETVAIALLRAGIVPTRRTPVTGEGRAPMCLMGVCFECLVDIDDRRNVQACMTEARDGMRVRLPQGARGVEQSE